MAQGCFPCRISCPERCLPWLPWDGQHQQGLEGTEGGFIPSALKFQSGFRLGSQRGTRGSFLGSGGKGTMRAERVLWDEFCGISSRNARYKIKPSTRGAEGVVMERIPQTSSAPGPARPSLGLVLALFHPFSVPATLLRCLKDLLRSFVPLQSGNKVPQAGFIFWRPCRPALLGGVG